MRYLVMVRRDCCSPWEDAGSVLLPPGCDSFGVETALQAVGVYAPRGADELEWYDEEVATIRDAEGFCMVRLVGAPRLYGVAR